MRANEWVVSGWFAILRVEQCDWFNCWKNDVGIVCALRPFMKTLVHSLIFISTYLPLVIYFIVHSDASLGCF